MANALYGNARKRFGAGLIHWGTGAGANNFSCLLVNTSAYTVDLAAHSVVTSVAAGARVATSTMVTQALSSGIMDASNITYSAVTGAVSEALIIYLKAASSSVSYLVSYIDTASAGLPVTPNGGDITVTWATSGVFRI